MSVSEEKRSLISKLTESGGRLRVRNAMNPILWLCGVTVPPGIVGLAFGNPSPIVTWIIAGIMIVVVLAAIGCYIAWMFRDPDRLQSEEYQIRSRTLDLIEEKGSKKAINAATVQAISQPEFLSMPAEREGEKK